MDFWETRIGNLVGAAIVIGFLLFFNWMTESAQGKVAILLACLAGFVAFHLHNTKGSR